MTISVQNPINEYLGNGSARTFNYTYYITTPADLKVYLNGVLQGSGFTVTGADNQSGGTVVFTVAPTTGTRVRLQRRIELERSIDYQEAAAIPTATLDRDFDRLWMAAQDTRLGTLTLDLGNTWNAGTFRIINVGDPVSAQDAATKHWVETALASPVLQAAGSAAAAHTSEVNAAASAADALTSATEAETHSNTATAMADNAALSASNAAISETASANSAEASALSAASIVASVGDAQAYATAAALSAIDASTSRNNAAASAVEASASAAAALISKSSASASAASAGVSLAASEVIWEDLQQALEDLESGGGAGVVSINGRSGVVVLTKDDVSLSDVDNTSDASKPVSTATQTALNAKASIASPTFTGTVTGITKSMVGLGQVDDTADASKPVSTAQQTALNLKAPLASPTFTGTVSGVTKAMVGLPNVDNTEDTAKPVSTAMTTALNLKANLAGAAFTGDLTISSAGSLVVSSKALTSPSSITYGTTTTINAASSNVFYVGTLTGNITTLTINNPTDGQTINIRFVQDGTGGRTVTLPSSVKAAGNLESVASRATWLILTYVSSASHWEGAYSGVPA